MSCKSLALILRLIEDVYGFGKLKVGLEESLEFILRLIEDVDDFGEL